MIFLLIGLFLGAVAVIFALQNITTITVTFLAWQLEGSLALILLLAMGAGVVISLLLSLPEVIRKSFQISRLTKHNTRLKDELVNKEIEVESEKSKVEANNAYLDSVERNPRV